MDEWDNAQWFSPLGKCRGCSKPATGNLMSDRNANLGPYCERCANKRVKACHKKGGFLPDYTTIGVTGLARQRKET